MRRLGQHFLKTQTVIHKIAGAISLGVHETIIEIGPGHGELTAALLERIGTKGRIIAIEKDPSLVEHLRKRFVKEPGIEIVEGDVRSLLAQTVKEIAGKPYKVAGNIPYYLTGQLFRILGECEPLPEEVVLMIQKEVADRVVAKPPDMNRLAASVQFWAKTKVIMNVSRHEFNPPPKVDSAVVRLTSIKNHSSTDSAVYYRMLRRLFQQPRKTILNNIVAGKKLTENAKKNLLSLLDRHSIKPTDRPQSLTVAQIEGLCTLSI